MKISHLLVIAALVATAACDSDGVVRPPRTEFAIFNAAPNLAGVAFYREEQVEANISYGGGAEGLFDTGQYDFHVEYFPAGATETIRSFSVSTTLAQDLDYIFVTTAPLGTPEFFIATRPDESQSDTAARVTLVHAFVGLGDVDVYIEPAGTDLTTVTPRGRLSYGPTPVSAEVPPGDYRVFLTTPNVPTDVIYESFDQTLSTVVDEILVVSDPGNLGTLSIQVSKISANTGRIGQVGQTAELRVIQGIDDRLDRDIYLSTTLVPPLFPAQPFGVLSPYLQVPIAQHMVITTPLGNPGTEEASNGYFALPGRYATAVIAGNTTDGVETHIVIEDKRSIAGQATVRIYNAAGQFDSAAIYLEEPGTDITTVNPEVNMVAPASTERMPMVAGDYEITIENLATQTVLAGPQLVTLDPGGVYGILLINGPDTSTVDIVLFDDFVP